ncbi:ParB/RepB/Spo0J family partition protein [Ruegeria sp. YS9]|uniref:ParB/RepB/Spo0J family partition protein n=1 Tax=Ruegeria sp. YS9 TaxID=2966453 RepID=UPI00214BDE48|nr:ParB/RepB/Spo0J family partition protein [Ruegeria sp. YS9]UUV08726.1 ParB N-terminal domain-containing protein [Ruegeria sp. YS9]
MTKQVTIPQVTETVTFADLYVSPLNPRTVVSEEEIAALAENIKVAGLIHNLAGYRHEGKDGVGVVAGGRRLRALALLQDDPRFQTVQVQIAEDEETAKIWATSENAQRRDLHPADEIRDYGALEKTGLTASQIAVAYGVTEKKVYRRLALAGLHGAVLDAFKASEISMSQAEAFTISNDEKLTLEVLEAVKAGGTTGWNAMSDYQIKQALKPDHIKGSDRRAVFVGVEAYQAAGGRISGDLFEDETLFDDPEILDEVFRAKIQKAATEYAEAEGWTWGEGLETDYLYSGDIDERNMGRIYKVEGEFTEEEGERYEELAELHNGDALDDEGQTELEALQEKLDGAFTDEQKAHAGILFYVGHSGKLQIMEGLVRSEDREAAEAAGILAKSAHKQEKPKKSPISDKLRGDLDRIVTGARQNALVNDPTLALDLLAFQLSQSQGWQRIHAYDVTLPYLPNEPETETGFALDKRLTLPDPVEKKGTLADDFKAFRKRGHKRSMDLLVRRLVGQLNISDADLGGLIDELTKKDTRDTFTPTAENFFDRVGGPYLVALWNDLLDLTPDHDAAKAFAALKKGEKAKKMEQLFSDKAVRSALGVTEAQEARIAAWLPEGMV